MRLWLCVFAPLCNCNFNDNKGNENKTLAELKSSKGFFFTAASLQNCCGQIYSKADHFTDPGNTTGEIVVKGLFTFGQKNSKLCEVK